MLRTIAAPVGRANENGTIIGAWPGHDFMAEHCFFPTDLLAFASNGKEDVMFKWFAALALGVAAAQLGCADDRGILVGTWKLVSYEVEIQATGQKETVMGRNPAGYVIFTAEGRAVFLLTGEGRKAPKTVQDRADLLSSLVAYTGTYRLEGDQWITKVEVAWNPEWVGTEQARFFKVTGEHLQVLTPWRVMPNWADKGMQRSIILFVRAK
jgi:hypothetical protein